MGGEVEIVARFPDETIVIDQFGDTDSGGPVKQAGGDCATDSTGRCQRHPLFRTTEVTTARTLSRISLAFGRVNRTTFHEDGERPETDTDHTVMLTLLALELAPGSMNRGLIAQFATVHDLPEVYAGDTQTLIISADERTKKEKRELQARERLRKELGRDSWICTLLEIYEKQELPEARFVRLLDKVLPKITHLNNRCIGAQRLGVTFHEFRSAHIRQHEELTVQYPELTGLLDLLQESMTLAEDAWPSDEVSND